MLRLTNLRLPLDHLPDALPAAICERLGVGYEALRTFTVFRRGYDARKRGAIMLIYTLEVEVADERSVLANHAADRDVQVAPDTTYHPVARPSTTPTHRPVVIGFGPCGIFAALTLAEAGLAPIVLERGKPVRERTKDTWDLWRQRHLHEDSNVQFGEGGAGTFSDGKLHSGIHDPRHFDRKVLQEFVDAGAPEEILYVSKPHIGTFRLVSMVEKIRARITALGGEIRFHQHVDDLVIETDVRGERRVRGVVLATGDTVRTDHLILAPGHSARDTFAMLLGRCVHLEPKPFSIGFRIEHPQSLIDRARFGPQAGHPILGAADYHLVHHGDDGRSVYSFCMCPGGTVVAATSEAGRVVTNGMSQYSRNERNANAALACDITPADFAPYGEGPLAGVALQRHWETHAFELGGGDYSAPAQRLEDFLAGRPTVALGDVIPSYQPGVRLTDLSAALPDYAVAAIRAAVPVFARQIRGYALPDAILTGVETRTSSPIRIRRDPASLQSLNTPGLYPAGEGAGYAGGILSAAVDGIRVAEAVTHAVAGR